ncbi:THO complex subunit 1 transcription elongation factor-domain-containing protein [Phellopilus nigrolimitatus]|nr:THO complex subunit 1 transcription elongation factor-domain-containing protein [Phellopilus nigrolimitatus]
MFSLSPYLENLLSSLPSQPITETVLDGLVKKAISESKQQTSPDNRRSQWEFLLRNEVYRLAETEGAFIEEPDESYYEALCNRLDIILSFSEHEACEATFLFTVLQDLLETQTVASCSHIFSWIEKRSDRLTEGMVPQKGKALVLLRTLNDLLRRLSKTGNTTTFCGRILTFLSAVFPLSERSGVNLRGEYGPQWEGVSFKKEVEERMEVDEVAPEQVEEKVVEEKKDEEKAAEVETAERSEEKLSKSKSSAEKTEDEKKEEFYNTFWSLQLPFSRPPLFAAAETLESFKSAINAVMPVIKEATVKERAMMGSKTVAGNLKRKRETTPTSTMDEGNSKYFFAKFLTSPELLDLEIADTLFRRQFLFQLLILLTHLLQFTKAEKLNWITPRNRSLQMDFTLQPDDTKWAQDTIARVYEELRQTTPNGRAFAETVQTILEREKNWVQWKNDMCSPFDKEPLPVSVEEETAHLRQKMREPMEDYKHKLGSEALTEIWAMGYRDLYDLENRFDPGDVKDFVGGIEKENARIKLRRQQLEKQAQRTQEARARAAAATKPAVPVSAPAAPASQAAEPPAVSLAPIAPIPQRVLPPGLAASPPLHPSLPAKPGTQQPVAIPGIPAQPSPAPASIPVPTPVPAPVPAQAPPVVVHPPEPTDPMIMKAEENKQRLSWLALRLARDEYLHHFGKIGNGDVIALAQEIEKEKERAQRGESQPANADPGAYSGSDRGATPSASNAGGLSDSVPFPPSQSEGKSGQTGMIEDSKETESAPITDNTIMSVDS